MDSIDFTNPNIFVNFYHYCMPRMVNAFIAQVILQLTLMSSGEPSALPFHLQLDDPAGNSFIQNLLAPHPDPQLTTRLYTRSPEQV